MHSWKSGLTFPSTLDKFAYITSQIQLVLFQLNLYSNCLIILYLIVIFYLHTLYLINFYHAKKKVNGVATSSNSCCTPVFSLFISATDKRVFQTSKPLAGITAYMSCQCSICKQKFLISVHFIQIVLPLHLYEYKDLSLVEGMHMIIFPLTS